MRIDFNQKGSWRKGPEFDQRDAWRVQDAAARLADFANCKLRLIGDAGEVLAYRDRSGEWRAKENRS